MTFHDLPCSFSIFLPTSSRFYDFLVISMTCSNTNICSRNVDWLSIDNRVQNSNLTMLKPSNRIIDGNARYQNSDLEVGILLWLLEGFVHEVHCYQACALGESKNTIERTLG